LYLSKAIKNESSYNDPAKKEEAFEKVEE